MIVIDYSKKPNDCGNARNLCWFGIEGGKINYFKRGGWLLRGKGIEDYWTWINEFVAIRMSDGAIVSGDFEKTIIATDQAALDDFFNHFQYSEWDYDDI